MMGCANASKAVLRQDPKAWQEGYEAGLAGKSSLIGDRKYGATSNEAWSFQSGWIEGDAKRQGFTPMGLPLKVVAGLERRAEK